VSDKIEQFWRPATPDDVAMIMRTGKPIAARFRNQDDEEWEYNWLCGWESSLNYLNELANPRKQCQVYDPPAWFVNKPDPGEGYRLLDKFPPEELWSSDEVWNDIVKAWDQTTRLTQCENLWYRRRIEANSPVILDNSRSRDTIPSGWRLLCKDEERLASDLYWSQGCNEWLLIGDDRVAIANELPRWYAIRQIVVADFFLLEGYDYSMPGGQTIRITEKGFEVL
jgi:hypothetical protein